MILFFEPIFKEKIWGGERLKEFGYKIPSSKTGECWGISAHPNGESIVKNGPYRGSRLSDLWDNHRHLFGGISGEKFPLLVKIIDANEDLSVQVHPDDNYAEKYENGELGKSECWYILDTREDGNIIYGTKATSREELEGMIDKGQWSQLLRTVAIKKGDFFYIPSGTVHALKAGTLILEIQQSSDTTYRLYDYNRKDNEGKLRDLHIDKSKDVIDLNVREEYTTKKTETIGGLGVTRLLESKYFTVTKYNLDGAVDLENNQPFILMSVTEGEGYIESDKTKYQLSKGDHFLISAETRKYLLGGKLEIIASHL